MTGRRCQSKFSGCTLRLCFQIYDSTTEFTSAPLKRLDSVSARRWGSLWELRTLETANDKVAPEYRDERGPGEMDSIDSRVGRSPMFKIDVDDHVEAQSMYHRLAFPIQLAYRVLTDCGILSAQLVNSHATRMCA